MVRKRKKVEVVKPWCFYCDREFNQEADLFTHQKSKHFKCPNCTKRLGSPRALSIHCLQVHKTGIQEIPEAKEGRKDPKWEIVGSVGIPPGMVRGGPVPPRGGGPLPASHTHVGSGPTAAVRPRLAYPPYPSGGGVMMPPPPVYGGVPPPPYYGAPPPPASSSLYGRPPVPPPPGGGGGGVGPPPRPPPPTAAAMPSSSSSQQQRQQQPAQYVSAPAHIHRKPTRAKQDDDT
ncbi:hypothetical protein M9435_000270 [Picochlorum sp. BPE23]|nr:hypothetical protein M9435_000270 [Picochlorum sp. BPE23]